MSSIKFTYQEDMLAVNSIVLSAHDKKGSSVGNSGGKIRLQGQCERLLALPLKGVQIKRVNGGDSVSAA